MKLWQALDITFLYELVINVLYSFFIKSLEASSSLVIFYVTNIFIFLFNFGYFALANFKYSGYLILFTLHFQCSNYLPFNFFFYFSLIFYLIFFFFDFFQKFYLLCILRSLFLRLFFIHLCLLISLFLYKYHLKFGVQFKVYFFDLHFFLIIFINFFDSSNIYEFIYSI